MYPNKHTTPPRRRSEMEINLQTLSGFCSKWVV